MLHLVLELGFSTWVVISGHDKPLIESNSVLTSGADFICSFCFEFSEELKGPVVAHYSQSI